VPPDTVEYSINYTLITVFASDLPIANLTDAIVNNVADFVNDAAETSAATTTALIGFENVSFGVSTEQLEIVVLTSAPSAAPSGAPSEAPSAAPSAVPSAAPSALSTAAPSSA
tara:strand:+ start:582 stop:920 length:339 start_codon:yes stop_codon:yes gene_type:complete